jgi:hypothetical protein
MGPGVQHIALKTDDIFRTMKELRMRSYVGGAPHPNPPPFIDVLTQRLTWGACQASSSCRARRTTTTASCLRRSGTP